MLPPAQRNYSPVSDRRGSGGEAVPPPPATPPLQGCASAPGGDQEPCDRLFRVMLHRISIEGNREISTRSVQRFTMRWVSGALAAPASARRVRQTLPRISV